MKKLLLAGCAFVAFSSPVLACSSITAVNGYNGVYYCCDNGLCLQPSSSLTLVSGTVTATCCTAQISDTTLAAWAASKAVESQQSAWWNAKKVNDLTREELDARQKKLEALAVWAKTLSNHIFASAYCDWVLARQNELAARRAALDQLDVALSLVKGLPTPPETGK